MNVNGLLAEVQGDDFAVILPLKKGQNLITATAARPDGLQGQASITINTETQQEFVRLTATPTSGILDQTGILNVTFEAEVYLVNPVSSYSWDFNGDGTPEITGPDLKVVAQYQYPGLYFPRVTVTDDQGNAYTETTIVHVLSREEMDALLTSKWEGMEGVLSQGNIESALKNFLESSKERYRNAFMLLQGSIQGIASNMQSIELIYLKEAIAKYRIIRQQVFNGQMTAITYYIYFTKNRDGIWQIEQF